MSRPLCSRNARPKKALVERAQWGTHPGHPGQRTQTSLEGLSLITLCDLGQGASRRARVGWV